MRITHKGFSLIEIMVGMTIGLIGMIVITQVYSASEANRLTTTSGGDAQQSGALGLQTIEREVRMAGYGINVKGFLGCNVRAHTEGPPAQDFNFSFVPVLITQGVGNLPDSITVTYSNNSMISSPASITQDMPAPTSVYKVNNRYGFTEGDLIIAAEAGKDCTLAQVTNVPGAPGQADNVLHNSGNYTNAQGVNVPAQYNKAGGLGISYTTKAKLYNIGPLPVNNTYFIQNNVLQINSSFGVDESIADGIVDMQAEYGVDTNADGIVDLYDVAADPNTVLSVRLGLIARSSKREPGCNITTVVPTWLGGSFNNITADANWQCYRYRVYQTNIVIRNMLWKPL
jgi:type IV pilus assembly protein PilW